MTIKTSLAAMMAVSLLLGAGCKKNEPTDVTNPDQNQSGGNAIGATPDAAAPPSSSAVATYPDMVVQSGTKQLLQPFTVYQAADTSSPVLSHVSVGQWINLKGSHGNWMLIEWPSGVGQMSPGWIELRGGVNDTRLSQTPPAAVDAGAPPIVDAGTPIVDAGAPKDAGTTAVDGGRRGITIKPRPR